MLLRKINNEKVFDKEWRKSKDFNFTYKIVKEVFTEKMTFEQIFEVGEGKSPVDLGEKNDKHFIYVL